MNSETCCEASSAAMSAGALSGALASGDVEVDVGGADPAIYCALLLCLVVAVYDYGDAVCVS